MRILERKLGMECLIDNEKVTFRTFVPQVGHYVSSMPLLPLLAIGSLPEKT